MEAGARVYQGKVIVTDDDEKVTIKCGKNIKMKINDIDCETFKIYEVTSKDKIECECEKTEAKRLLDIILSEDKMKAFVKISYIPEIQYKLKDRENFLNLAIAAEKGNSIEPPHFSAEELKKELNAKGIVYGINEDKLEYAAQGTGEEVLIAEGIGSSK